MGLKTDTYYKHITENSIQEGEYMVTRVKNITVQEIAEHLKISTRSVFNLTKQRKIPFKKISKKCLRFDIEKVEEALNRFEVKAL